MANLELRIGTICLILVTIMGQSTSVALPISEAVEIVADRLEAEQIKDRR